jgi:hypothetical protein
MKRSTTSFRDMPLFADPPDIWNSLDDGTRHSVVERIARLLLAHEQVDSGCSALPKNSDAKEDLP